MLKHRKPDNTIMLSCSQECIDDFEKYYGEDYTKFKSILLWHSSELEYSQRPINCNIKPVILGNWNHPKKGGEFINKLREKLVDEFEFLELNTKPTRDIFSHNSEIVSIYSKCDIFLQLSRSEGNSYATLDAFCQNLLVIGTNVGLLYDLEKMGETDVALIFDYNKMSDIDFVADNIRVL